MFYLNNKRDRMAARLASAAICAALLCASCAQESKTVEKLPDLPVRYASADAVDEAFSRLSSAQTPAEVLTDVKTVRKAVFLTFDGITDGATTSRLLDLLDKHSAKASFFLPGIKAAEDPDTTAAIAKRGHNIGNYTLSAETQMETFSAEALTEDFARTNAILSNITGAFPSVIKCRSTEYTDEVLKAAKAAGVSYVLKSNRDLSYQSFRSIKDAQGYVSKLGRGSVISIHVDSVLNEYEYEASEEEVSESSDAPATVVARSTELTTLPSAREASREDRLVTVVELLLNALAQERFMVLPAEDIPKYMDSDFTLNFKEIRTENGGELSDLLTNARTTMRGVAVSFRSLSDGERLDRLLAALEAENIKATFYVTGLEIVDYPENIDKILQAGHVLENGGMSGLELSTADFEEVSLEIYKCGKLLNDKYGVTSRLFMPVGGRVTDTILEAANAQGYSVATYNKNPVGSGVNDVAALTGYFSGGFNRGDIIFGDLEKSDKWELFIPPIANMVRGTGYDFPTVEQLFSNQYPLYEPAEIPGWSSIRINSAFNSDTPRQEDYILKVNTDDKVIFLTFDDWGSDKTITGLLDVLGQYNAKATFFARANGVEMNPNLARAISELGHDLVSHSFEHRPIVSISTQELQADTVKAHRILTQAQGKMPPLFYRPPTLEYDDRALNALFASGYKYLISGVPSTHDYENTARQVIDMVLEAAEPGCIPIMHMSDNSCAREAISVIIPTLKAQGYTFARLSDYLK